MPTMPTIGYAAMFEQFAPSDLPRYCQTAEAAGFTSVMASDHFHPWTPGQGQSGFVWAWLGGHVIPAPRESVRQSDATPSATPS